MPSRTQLRRARKPWSLVALTVGFLLPAWLAAADFKLRSLVESGVLAESPNSVLLDYLLHEGKNALPPDVHQLAVDQIVEALRSQTLVDPLEGMSEMMAFANPMKMFGDKKGMMKQMGMGMLRSAAGGGGGMSSGMDAQMQKVQRDMQDAMIDPWVRGLGAASTLYQAGYTEDAIRFYRGCLTSIGSMVPTGQKNDWLQDQCIAGALQMEVTDAGGLFAEVWDNPQMDFGIDFSAFGGEAPEMEPVPQIQAAAALGLGKLVGTGQLTSQQHSAVMQALISMAETKSLDVMALTGAVQGLSFADDPEAVEPLRRMWKKGKPEDIRPIALGSLVAGYRQPDAIKVMRKDLKTGKGVIASYRKAKSFAPWTSSSTQRQAPSRQQEGDDAEARYLAARALIRAGDDAGYEFAAEFLDKRTVPPGDWDYRPDLIRDLVETGGERGRAALEQNVIDGHQNEWLEAMMRVGLLELGDPSQATALEALVDKKDWDFGRGTAARWYKRFKPLLWESAKLAAKTYMGMPPDQQDWRRMQQMVTNMAWAERDRIAGRKSERELRTDQFRWQLADALAEVDDPSSLKILSTLLDDEEASVRLSAVSALLEQSDPQTPELLLDALGKDYGSENEISRNPEIHAAILRRLVRTFRDHPATPQALNQGVGSAAPSVRMLAMTATGDFPTAGGAG